MQDIIAGSFKGFAMLRAYANQQSRPGVQFDQLTNQHQVQPLYIKGYGFLPPSQVCPRLDIHAEAQGWCFASQNST